ncbi:MAG TPA: glycosyltransferase family 2 protein [Terriglobales bacterium]|nr:glycosyltransferase family 2 protein [Terriglobales bacterium]
MEKSEANPVVSVIVPARNEEACLAACLESLVGQTGINYEIIVVDDASTDRTGEIARSFSGLEVIEAGPLPENWTGKNHAMSAGAKIAKGKWLLFTDADTVHKPGSLAHAVAEAEQHGAALLSYSPEQEVRTLWEKAVMPVIFAELAATHPPSKVSDPNSPIAAANGQYLLISRAAYDAIGGHTKIASDLLEDVAIARRVKSSGRKIFFRYGGDAVRTRMYRTWEQMKEGWSKNLALLFPGARVLGLLRGCEFVLIWASIVASIALFFYKDAEFAVGTASLAGILLVLFWWRIRRAHFSIASNLLGLGGLGIFAYLLLRSVSVRRKGAVKWKGREYVGNSEETQAEPVQTGSSGRFR